METIHIAPTNQTPGASYNSPICVDDFLESEPESDVDTKSGPVSVDEFLESGPEAESESDADTKSGPISVDEFLELGPEADRLYKDDILSASGLTESIKTVSAATENASEEPRDVSPSESSPTERNINKEGVDFIAYDNEDADADILELTENFEGESLEVCETGEVYEVSPTNRDINKEDVDRITCDDEDTDAAVLKFTENLDGESLEISESGEVSPTNRDINEEDVDHITCDDEDVLKLKENLDGKSLEVSESGEVCEVSRTNRDINEEDVDHITCDDKDADADADVLKFTENLDGKSLEVSESGEVYACNNSSKSDDNSTISKDNEPDKKEFMSSETKDLSDYEGNRTLSTQERSYDTEPEAQESLEVCDCGKVYVCNNSSKSDHNSTIGIDKVPDKQEFMASETKDLSDYEENRTLSTQERSYDTELEAQEWTYEDHCSGTEDKELQRQRQLDLEKRRNELYEKAIRRRNAPYMWFGVFLLLLEVAAASIAVKNYQDLVECCGRSIFSENEAVGDRWNQVFFLIGVLYIPVIILIEIPTLVIAQETLFLFNPMIGYLLAMHMLYTTDTRNAYIIFGLELVAMFGQSYILANMQRSPESCIHSVLNYTLAGITIYMLVMLTQQGGYCIVNDRIQSVFTDSTCNVGCIDESTCFRCDGIGDDLLATQCFIKFPEL